MLDEIKITYYCLREALAEGNMKEFLHSRVFWNRVATPVELDLSTLPPKKVDDKGSFYKYVELTLSDLQSDLFSVPTSSRRAKAHQYLIKGLRCFIIITNSKVVGDIWFTVHTPGQEHFKHPDLDMLGIQCRDNEVYGFDMYIAPQYRGKNLAVPLQSHLHYALKEEGYQKVYGYYWNDNLPAMWMHRLIKFRELPKRQVTHLLLFRWARFLTK